MNQPATTIRTKIDTPFRGRRAGDAIPGEANDCTMSVSVLRVKAVTRVP
jgi:hypothetical protein